ncbi:hypothetical protein [Crocosphaera sp.]|uniref:hypothetical protein n=1 Tax=Crocosphaera sp. TaxID=2729996 RepID=UPI003F1ECA0C|nr:hypothetical protein [Crocosphaera sp.]
MVKTKKEKEKGRLQEEFIWTIVYYNEFLYWYSHGTKYIKKNSCFVDKDSQKSGISSDVKNFLKENVIYYSYDEDYEVVIVLAKYKPEESLAGIDYYQFTSLIIEKIYPISQRGKQFLEAGRIPQFITLCDPILEVEKTVTQLEAKHHNQEALMAARNLSEMAANRILEIRSEEDNNRKEDIKQAIISLNQQKEVPIENGTFCENLFCYVRRRPKIPDSDFGYFYDLGLILRTLQQILNQMLDNGEENNNYRIPRIFIFYPHLLDDFVTYRDVIKHLSKLNNEYDKRLNDYRNQLNKYKQKAKKATNSLHQEQSLWHIIDSQEIDINSLQYLIPEQYSVISCLVFLKLKAELYDSLGYSPKPLKESSFNDLITHLKHEHKSELLTGLWLIGAYCGYQHFADEFYRELQNPF